MKPELLIQSAITPALSLLPPKMDTQIARTIMLAIAWQESGMKHRKQVRGPARGYWQFEMGGGVRGVLNHAASASHIKQVLTALDYPDASIPADSYALIEHNDTLAAAFARLLLWTDPAPLPSDSAGAWALYIRTWRPGKPHPATWHSHYLNAMEFESK